MALNYIGSKHSLLSFLDSSIEEATGGDQGLNTFGDFFSGSGVVGEHFKKKGYSVIANDTQYYSYVINKYRLANEKPLQFNGLTAIIPSLKNKDSSKKPGLVCDYLNNLSGRKGFIYKYYSPGGSKNQRLYFTNKNSMRCDAIRQTLKNWQKMKAITEGEFHFLLCSLIEQIDQHANTASIYGAFLKQFKKSAKQDFWLKPAQRDNHQSSLFETKTKVGHQTKIKVYQEDANSLVKEVAVDIAYLDPPYNHRQYASNYHLLETIARYDSPEITGLTGLRANYFRSSYCQKSKILKTFGDLIDNLQARYIFLSYNNEGLMSFEDIKRIMSRKGQYSFFEKTYGRYKADSQRFNKFNQTKEYLHCLKVG